jgi:hypothetical protein
MGLGPVRIGSPQAFRLGPSAPPETEPVCAIRRKTDHGGGPQSKDNQVVTAWPAACFAVLVEASMILFSKFRSMVSAAALSGLVLLACGGSEGPSTSGTSGAVSICGARGAAFFSALSSSAAAPEHRPTATACSATYVVPDAGAASCEEDSDCLGDAAYPLAPHCVQHFCLADQCLTDSDCGAGAACDCSPGGNSDTSHANQCAASTCLVDADCPSGLCSPTTSGCNSFGGYHCRSCADTCSSDSDCADAVTRDEAGDTQQNLCTYVPAVGLWQCGPVTVCSG